MNVDPSVLRQVVAGLQDGVTVRDRDCRIIYQNAVARERAGSEIGEVCHEAPPGSGHGCDGCVLGEVFATGEPAVAVHAVVDAEGTKEHWESAGIPLFDAAGEIVAGAETCRNVTERFALGATVEERNRELTQVNREYRTVLENMPDFVVRYDRDLRRVYVNPAWEAAARLTAAEVIGVTADSVRGVSSPVVVEYEEKLRRAFATGRPDSCSFEWWNAAGELLFLEYEIIPEPGADGSVATVLAVGRDLTEHRRTADALREQQRHAQSLLRLSRRLEAAEVVTEAIAAARDEVREVIGYTNLWVYLLTDDRQHADVLAAEGTLAGSIVGDQPVARLDIAGDPMLEEIAAAEGPVVVEDARLDGRTDKEIVSRLGNRTIVNIPIALPDRCLGSLGTGSFGDEGVRVPTSSELAYLAAVASHMAVSLDRIQLRRQQEATTESLRRLNRKLRAISVCNQLVIRADSERGLLDEVCHVICEEAGYLLAWVGYAEHDEARSIRPVAWAGPGSDYVAAARLSWAADDPRGLGPAGCAVRDGVTVAVNDIAVDVRMAPWRERALQRGYRAGMALPLKDTSGAAFGVLLVYYGEAGVISSDEITLLEELAEDLAFGISTLRDRAAREEAQRQVSLLSSAINGVREAAYLLDDEARFCYVNDEACRALGYTREELLTMRVFDIDPEFPAERWTETRAALQEQRLVAFETLHRAKDGHLFPVEIRTSYLVVDGNGFGLALARDISERKEAEDRFRQAEKLESVGQLAGGVAHDFNNMLAIILGCAEIAMTMAQPDDPQLGYLEEVVTAANNAGDLTRQLLTFARRQVIAPRVIDLNSAVEGMLKMLRRLLGEDKVLVWAPGGEAQPVNMDPTQLDQILVNLCVNARDAIEDGGTIRVGTGDVVLDAADCATRASLVPGRYAVLTVSDDGRGMDRATRERIFEPFFTTKGVGRGTGLGLATVYGIVTQNNGFIDVVSEPGRGTSFTIYLPREVPAALRPGGRRRGVEMAQGSGTILLVEDEPGILRVTTKMLESFGYRVLVAASPAEALEHARAAGSEIDLVMTDVVMPDMSGRELARAVNRYCPGVACLYMSGYSTDEIARHGILETGIHFIQKPFTMRTLAAKVREVLRGRSEPAPPAGG